MKGRRWTALFYGGNMNLRLKIVIIYLLAVNAVTLVLYGADKSRAKRGKWRISEKTLLLGGVIGGMLGGLAGMKLFHHKTKHLYFYAVNILSLLLWIAVCVGFFVL